MVSSNSDTKRYYVEIKLRIANGCGESVRNGMKKNIGPGLVKGGAGAITLVGDLEENMPNNGFTGFDWYGK